MIKYKIVKVLKRTVTVKPDKTGFTIEEIEHKYELKKYLYSEENEEGVIIFDVYENGCIIYTH